VILSPFPTRSSVRRPATFAVLATTVTLLATPALLAQEGSAGDDGAVPAPPAATNGSRGTSGEFRGPRGRRLPPDELVALGFSNVAINEVFPFIAEETGKIVIPVDVNLLQTKRITLLNDAPVPRSMALDLVFEAFRLNGVGIIEREDVVIVGNLDTITTNQVPPIIPATEDIMDRMDRGTLVAKFIQLEKVKASQALEILQEKELPTYAQLSADDNSNQILVYGDIALCQQIKKIIDQLDETFKAPRTSTFRLAYADAIDIQASIEELYSESGTSGQQNRNTRQPQRGRGNQVQPPTPGDPVGLTIELRTTVNTQQNSVTVVGDPAVVEEIGRLIETDWDLPRKPGSNRIYTLEYTDPIKLANVINELLGQSSGTGGGARRVGGQQGGTDISDALAGIYQLQPFPESNQLVVLAKTEESLEFLDGIITELDQPSEIGLPFVVELKHANAFELAEQLNALLAEPGSGATIRAPEEGLSGRSLDDETGGGGGDAGSAGTLSFPWQRSGRQNDEQSPESQLIGKVRIVPIIRQNALAVLCPRPQKEAVQELVAFFDRPGRQVMLSVIIAEIDLTNDLALGLRLSLDGGVLSTANPDNAVGFTLNGTGNRQGSGGSLFDSTVLDASLNLNVLLQALDQDTNVRVLQQPVVFTADNQEAFFFDGQDIPFITETVINSQGNPTDSFDYRPVGVILNARPRITAQREVDIDLRLELSAIVPGQTLFGGAIIDKRETTTNVVVKNGQTIVLSGILRESETRITRKVPLLGDLPLIGELFKSRSNQTVTTELVAFITPLVVDNPTDNDTNFQEDWRRRLEELSQPINDQIDRTKELYEERWGDRFKPSRSIPMEGDDPVEPGTTTIGENQGTTIYDPERAGRDRRDGAGVAPGAAGDGSDDADDAQPRATPAPRVGGIAEDVDGDGIPDLVIPAPLTTSAVAVMSRDELLVMMRDLATLRSRVRREPGRGPLADRLSLDLSLVTRRLAELDAIDRQRAGADAS
jgi:general secretion pathway protein D